MSYDTLVRCADGQSRKFHQDSIRNGARHGHCFVGKTRVYGYVTLDLGSTGPVGGPFAPPVEAFNATGKNAHLVEPPHVPVPEQPWSPTGFEPVEAEEKRAVNA